MVIVSLAIIIILLIIYIIFINKDIKNIRNSLRDIREESFTNTKLPDNINRIELKYLIYEINSLLEAKQNLTIDQIRKDKENKEIIASISHDLRTPLTSIKGYINLLKDKFIGEEELRILEVIDRRADVLGQLISSFYELSKLELKKEELKLEYVDIKEILLNILVTYYDKFNEKGIEPNINIDDNKEFCVIGDIRAIERIFLNLIDNGYKYSNNFFEISLIERNGYIISEFINDNKGLKEKDIEKIFNKFYTFDTSRQGEATGLGLFITKELVESMGYEIETDIEDNNLYFKIKWENNY